MRGFYQVALFTILVCVMYTTGVYFEQTQNYYGINELWFTLAEIGIIVLGVANVLFMMLLFGSENTTKDAKSFILEFGDDPYSPFVILYPFVLLLAVNIQSGSLLGSACLAAITLCNWFFLRKHKMYLLTFLKDLAEKGTKNT